MRDEYNTLQGAQVGTLISLCIVKGWMKWGLSFLQGKWRCRSLVDNQTLSLG